MSRIRASERGIGGACVATIIAFFHCATSPTFAQWEWLATFDDPIYAGAPGGVPLAGQQSWQQVSPPGSGEWLVHTYSGNPFGLAPPMFSSTGFSNGFLVGLAGGPQDVVSVERPTPDSSALIVALTVLPGATLPSAEEIGRIEFLPENTRDFGVVLMWNNTALPDTWRMEFIHYDENGVRVQESLPGFDNLAHSTWFELSIISTVLYSNSIGSIGLRDGTTGKWIAGSSPQGWYRGGGINPQGYLEVIRLSSGDATSPGTPSVLGMDYVQQQFNNCYNDCDSSGGLDFYDFLCFQNLFVIGHSYADCDGSGTMDWFDFLCFQNAFASGCGP